MPDLKLYTLRGKHSGRLYYATGFTMLHAARELGISVKSLILERSEIIPVQADFSVDTTDISRHTARYRKPT